MANITKTQVDAASLEIVSSMINLNLQRALVMPGKLIDMSGEASPGVDKIKIRKFGDLTVGTKLPSTDVVFGISTLSTDDLNLDQHKYVAFLMEEFAKIQGPQTFLQELAQNGAIKIAQTYDKFLIDTVDAGAATGALVAPGVVAKQDFINARKALDLANVPLDQRYVGINPEDYADVLAESSFVDADKLGMSNIQTGVVGQVFGFNVIMNTGFTAGQLLAWQYNCAAGALQMSPTIKTVYDVDALGDKWVIHTIYGSKILKATSAIKLT